MKKIALSLIFISTFSIFTLANDDTQKVSLWKPHKSGAYIGLGYGYLKQSIKDIDYPDARSFSLVVDSIMFQGGYKYNSYFSLEGRYWLGVTKIRQSGGSSSGTYSGNMDAYGIYLKPNIPFDNGLKLYALFGYADTSVRYDNGSKWDTDGYSCGIGLEYLMTKDMGIFIDYIKLNTARSFDYNDQNDIDAKVSISTFNFGLNYKFQF